MPARVNLLAALVASILAAPAAAQTSGPATIAAFDGRYVGVSVRAVNHPDHPKARCVLGSNVPAPLTITNGIARQAAPGQWQGSVSPQGGLVMQRPNGVRFNGQIDNQGVIRGETNGVACTVTIVWRKQ